MTATQLQEIANPAAAVAWHWVDTYDGWPGEYAHEIVWVRGTSSLQYGTKGSGQHVGDHIHHRP